MSSDKMNAYKKQKRYLRFFLRYTFMVKILRRFPVRFRSGKTKGTAFAVPSAYGVIIKIK